LSNGEVIVVCWQFIVAGVFGILAGYKNRCLVRQIQYVLRSKVNRQICHNYNINQIYFI